MEQSTQTEISLTELSKDIYAKLDSIQAVLGYILEKTNLIPNPNKPITAPYSVSDKINKMKYPEEDLGEQTDDDLDARDASGSVLPQN
jgi:hypothetical protein